MYIGIVGNPVDGFTFYGPFESAAEAIDYADRHFCGRDWWLSDVEPKDVEPKETE